MKRYLIMTASIGSGHIKAAEAIARELRAADPEAIIEVVDLVKHFPGDSASYNGFKSHYKTGQWRMYRTENAMEKIVNESSGGLICIII